MQKHIHIIPRAKAKELGMTRYFTGIPCRHGHICEKKTSSCDCIECAKQKDKAYYEKNSEKIKAASSKRHYENIEYISMYNRNRYMKDPKSVADRKNEWRILNPDRVREKSRIYAQNRRARLLGAGGSHDISDIEDKLKHQRNKCASCNKKLDSYEVDHIIPISKGGSNDPDNIQILCISCNRSKGAKDPIDWEKSKGRLL